jgi:uncharacterized repeat protein (TIGR02543 family)/LPXTG-motif cell wall-anchored protein
MVNGGYLTIQDSTIQNNHAPNAIGGGMRISGGAHVTIDSSSVTGNSAALDGGGIYQKDNSTMLAVTGNSSITNNTAGGDGGGIWVLHDNLPNLDVGPDVVFSANSAQRLAKAIAPEDQPTYDTHVLGTAWTATTPVTKGYNNYDIAYDAWAVTFIDYNGTVINLQGVRPDNKAVLPADPVRPGYAFTGWLSTDTTLSAESSITADATFQAQWTNTPPVINVKRDVIYVQQGVTLTQAQILAIAGVSITDAQETIPLSKLSVSGYSGIKWSVANFPGEGYVLTLDVSDTPGLPAATRQIAIFVQSKDTPIKPGNPDPTFPIDKLPPGMAVGTDPFGNPIIYMPTVAQKLLSLPQTGDAPWALAPLGALALVLAFAALMRRRRRLTA